MDIFTDLLCLCFFLYGFYTGAQLCVLDTSMSNIWISGTKTQHYLSDTTILQVLRSIGKSKSLSQ